MANQQLVDYIAQQLRVGMNRDAIKKALIDVGWKEGDVNEAMAPPSASPPSGPAPQAEKTATATPARTGTPVATASSKIAAPATPATGNIILTGAGGVFGDVSEPLFTPATGTAKTVIIAKPAKAAPIGTPKRSRGGVVAAIALGVIVVVLAALLVIVYFDTMDLKAKVDVAGGEKNGLAAQIAGLNKKKTALEARTQELEAENKELKDALAVFATPNFNVTNPPGAVVEEKLAVKGTVAMSAGSGLYTVMLPHDIVLVIKNSKDPKVDALLRPLAKSESAVSISASHVPGSREVTLLGVEDLSVADTIGPAPARPSSTPASAASPKEGSTASSSVARPMTANSSTTPSQPPASATGTQIRNTSPVGASSSSRVASSTP